MTPCNYTVAQGIDCSHLRFDGHDVRGYSCTQVQMRLEEENLISQIFEKKTETIYNQLVGELSRLCTEAEMEAEKKINRPGAVTAELQHVSVWGDQRFQ